MIKKFAATIIALVLTGLTTLATPITTQAASCYAASCQGRDPQLMGCWRDAQTVGISPLPGTAAAGWNEIVELRSSKICGAQWSRVRSRFTADNLYMTAYHAIDIRATRVTRRYSTLIWSKMAGNLQDESGACGNVVTWDDPSYSPVHCVKANRPQ